MLSKLFNQPVLSDWSQASLTTLFATVTDITSEMELHAYKWSINVNQHNIMTIFTLSRFQNALYQRQCSYIFINQANGSRLITTLHGKYHAEWSHHLVLAHVLLDLNNIDASIQSNWPLSSTFTKLKMNLVLFH